MRSVPRTRGVPQRGVPGGTPGPVSTRPPPPVGSRAPPEGVGSSLGVVCVPQPSRLRERLPVSPSRGLCRRVCVHDSPRPRRSDGPVYHHQVGRGVGRRAGPGVLPFGCARDVRRPGGRGVESVPTPYAVLSVLQVLLERPQGVSEDLPDRRRTVKAPLPSVEGLSPRGPTGGVVTYPEPAPHPAPLGAPPSAPD